MTQDAMTQDRTAADDHVRGLSFFTELQKRLTAVDLANFVAPPTHKVCADLVDKIIADKKPLGSMTDVMLQLLAVRGQVMLEMKALQKTHLDDVTDAMKKAIDDDNDLDLDELRRAQNEEDMLMRRDYALVSHLLDREIRGAYPAAGNDALILVGTDIFVVPPPEPIEVTPDQMKELGSAFAQTLADIRSPAEMLAKVKELAKEKLGDDFEVIQLDDDVSGHSMAWGEMKLGIGRRWLRPGPNILIPSAYLDA